MKPQGYAGNLQSRRAAVDNAAPLRQLLHKTC